MTATTKKITKALPFRSDSIDFEVKPISFKFNPGLKTGYKYNNPIAVLIKFEEEKRDIAFKVMNKEDISFTDVINNALDLLLYTRGLIVLDKIRSLHIRDIIKLKGFKQLKYKKKQE